MQLSFRRKSAKVDRKTTRQLIEFCAAQLLTPRLSKNLHITVRYLPNILTGKQPSYGWVSKKGVPPRHFYISCDDGLSIQMTLRTLAHEMVHVRQYATGQMKDYTRWEDRYRWNGKIQRWNPNCSRKEYKTKYPDEREALRLEKVLWRKFVKWKASYFY